MKTSYRMQRVKAGRHEIAIHELGSGAPVVLVHGLMGCSQTWGGVAERLARRGFHAIVPELIGFGQSERATDIDSLWLGAQADALLAALEPRLPCGAVFAGHDYGGPTIVTLYRRAPRLLRAMMLISCNLRTDTPIPFPLSSWSWPFLGKLMRKAVLSRPSMAMAMRSAARQRVQLPIGAYLGNDLQLAAIQEIFSHAILELPARYREVEETLPQIATPVTVLWGDSDPFFPVGEGRRIAACIPGAGFRRLEGCGHFAPEERPSEVAAAILELAGEASGPSPGSPGGV